MLTLILLALCASLAASWLQRHACLHDGPLRPACSTVFSSSKGRRSAVSFPSAFEKGKTGFSFAAWRRLLFTSLPVTPQAQALDEDDVFFAHRHHQNHSNARGVLTSTDSAPLAAEWTAPLDSRGDDDAAAATPTQLSPVVEDDASEGLVDADGHGEDVPDLQLLMSELANPASGVELLSDLHQPPSDEELQAQLRHQQQLANDAAQSRLFRDHHAGLWTGVYEVFVPTFVTTTLRHRTAAAGPDDNDNGATAATAAVQVVSEQLVLRKWQSGAVQSMVVAGLAEDYRLEDHAQDIACTEFYTPLYTANPASFDVAALRCRPRADGDAALTCTVAADDDGDAAAAVGDCTEETQARNMLALTGVSPADVTAELCRTTQVAFHPSSLRPARGNQCNGSALALSRCVAGDGDESVAVTCGGESPAAAVGDGTASTSTAPATSAQTPPKVFVAELAVREAEHRTRVRFLYAPARVAEAAEAAAATVAVAASVDLHLVAFAILRELSVPQLGEDGKIPFVSPQDLPFAKDEPGVPIGAPPVASVAEASQYIEIALPGRLSLLFPRGLREGDSAALTMQWTGGLRRPGGAGAASEPSQPRDADGVEPVVFPVDDRGATADDEQSTAAAAVQRTRYQVDRLFSTLRDGAIDALALTETPLAEAAAPEAHREADSALPPV
eukprot:gene11284-8017_t